jgi:hypothetical protein
MTVRHGDGSSRWCCGAYSYDTTICQHDDHHEEDGGEDEDDGELEADASEGATSRIFLHTLSALEVE